MEVIQELKHQAVTEHVLHLTTQFALVDSDMVELHLVVAVKATVVAVAGTVVLEVETVAVAVAEAATLTHRQAT
jgi:hypothetical protein